MCGVCCVCLPLSAPRVRVWALTHTHTHSHTHTHTPSRSQEVYKNAARKREGKCKRLERSGGGGGGGGGAEEDGGKRIGLDFRTGGGEGARAVWVCGLSVMHVSEPTRQGEISYAVVCLQKRMPHSSHPRLILNAYDIIRLHNDHLPPPHSPCCALRHTLPSTHNAPPLPMPIHTP